MITFMFLGLFFDFIFWSEAAQGPTKSGFTLFYSWGKKKIVFYHSTNKQHSFTNEKRRFFTPNNYIATNHSW